MKFKILVSDSMAREGLKVLENEQDFQVDVKLKLDPKELKKIVKDYDAIVIRSGTKLTKEIIEAAGKLKVIGRAGVGLDNVDVEAASRKGVMVMNTPGGNTVSTAEHTMALLLALSRNISLSSASMRKGEWERNKFMGVELYGKVLGIVGLGRIGTEVAKRALSFGMKIMAYDPFLSADKAKALGIELTELPELLKEADYITVHTPLTDDTRHMISEKEFALMKNGVRVINCARGGIIDEAALAKAIETGKVVGAALDVFEKEPPADSPLVKMDKVLTTSHLGASTEEAQVNVSIDIAETVRDALLGKGLRNTVNIPSVEPETLKFIQPYITLAEKIGSIQTQLVEGHIKRVKVKYIGDIIQYNLTPITIALVKGLLTPMLGENVNYVNAVTFAKERGINVVESKTAEIQDFANLIAVTVETNKAESFIMGTLFTKSGPRIVKINEYYVEVTPGGVMLFIFNKDVPGIVGAVGTLLGKNKINIASMTFGRVKRGGDAISVLNVDSNVPPKVLGELKKIKNIYDVKVVKTG